MKSDRDQDGVSTALGLDAKFGLICLGFSTAVLACFLVVLLCLSAMQKTQQIEHSIAGIQVASMNMFHASMDINGPGAHSLPIQTGDASLPQNKPPSEKSSQMQSGHDTLMAATIDFRKRAKELRAFFEPAASATSPQWSDVVDKASRLVGFGEIPGELREIWNRSGSGSTIGQLLSEQAALCVEICMSPDMSLEERTVAMIRLRDVAVDQLLPDLILLHDAAHEWQHQSVTTVEIMIATAFALLILMIVLARHKLVRPLAIRLEQTTAQLQVQNSDLEQRVQERTEKLSTALAAAEAASTAKSKFLGVMSHELRTPMNGVLGLSALLEQSDLPEAQHKLVQAIRQSGRSLLRIIEDVLEMKTIEAGKLQIENRSAIIREVIQDTLALHLPQAQSKGLDLKVDLDGALNYPVLTDPERLQQVVNNLVSNAIKFTKDGVVTVALSETVAEDSVNVVIEVSDTGEGVSSADRERIFEPFERTDAAYAISGTGLGLSICRELVAELGGEIGVTSGVGQGSCFTITLSPRRVHAIQGKAAEIAA